MLRVVTISAGNVQTGKAGITEVGVKGWGKGKGKGNHQRGQAGTRGRWGRGSPPSAGQHHPKGGRR